MLAFEMTLHSKHRAEKLKTENQRYTNTKNQNSERQKPSFTKTHTEQNNDHTRIMHKIKFRSSFN